MVQGGNLLKTVIYPDYLAPIIVIFDHIKYVSKAKSENTPRNRRKHLSPGGFDVADIVEGLHGEVGVSDAVR